MASKAFKSNGEERKKKNSYNLKLSSEQMDKLGKALESRGWISRTVQYARHAFEGESVRVVAYESGKLVVQGRNTEDFVANIWNRRLRESFYSAMRK